MLFFVITLLFTSLYDIRYANATKTAIENKNSKRYRYRPHITAIVYSHNNSAGLEKTLDNLRSSQYKKIDTVIVDTASSDNSQKLVRNYIKQFPKQTVRLIAQRNERRLIDSMRAVDIKSIRGEIVIVLQAGDSFDSPRSLYEFVNVYNTEQAKRPVLFDVSPHSMPSISNLLARYRALLMQRQYKMLSSGRILHAQHFTTGVAYPRDLFKGVVSKKPPTLALSYAPISVRSDNISHLVLGSPMALRNAQRIGMITLFALFVTAFTGVLSVAYATYVAFDLRQTTLLAVYVVVAIVWVLHAVWNSQSIKYLDKLRYSIALPATVVPSFLYIITTIVAALRLITRYRMRAVRLSR